MIFDIPTERLLEVDEVDVRLLPGAHPFEAANIDAIEANWALDSQANPALYDGRMSLLASLAYRDRRLVGGCHLIRFATFLYWRKTRPAADTAHAFAQAMPVTTDGALIAVRMGAHTANPGRVYFAAGSFEPEDFPDGRVDVDYNMAREVGEETGLDIARLPRDPIYHAWSMASATVIIRRYRLPFSAEEASASIRAFVAAEADPEIEGPVVIRTADDIPAGAMPYIGELVSWHFASERGDAAGRGA